MGVTKIIGRNSPFHKYIATGYKAPIRVVLGIYLLVIVANNNSDIDKNILKEL